MPNPPPMSVPLMVIAAGSEPARPPAPAGSARKRLGARQPVSAWELRRLRRPGERGAEGEPTWAG
eukprot:scaffold36310_cov118-Isochrysis_galbana.AAC.3